MTALNMIKDETFRFDPISCRSANIPLQEAKFLRWLFLAERSNADIAQTFGGLGLAYHLLKLGHVENPLGEKNSAFTNLWKLRLEGVNVLRKVVGQTSIHGY